MDDEEEGEDDDPTSASASRETVIADDVLFLCFEWCVLCVECRVDCPVSAAPRLFASDLSRCMAVSHRWLEAAQDNHLWKLHCAMCFRRVSKFRTVSDMLSLRVCGGAGLYLTGLHV